MSISLDLSVENTNLAQKKQESLSSDSQSQFIYISDIREISQSEIHVSKLSSESNDQIKFKSHYSLQQNKKKTDDFYINTLINSSNLPSKTIKSFLRNCHDDIQYALTQLQSPPQSYIEQKKINLPILQDCKGKDLFINLDTTLISICQPDEKPEHILEFKCNKDKKKKIKVGLNLRPFIFQFLKTVSQYWNVYIFSTVQQHITKKIVRFLDPQKKYIKGILSKENCMQTNRGYYIKDLRIIEEYNLSKMAILDSNANAFSFQIDNGVPILDWYHDCRDQELLYIMQYLVQLSFSKDVRITNREKLKLEELGTRNIHDITL